MDILNIQGENIPDIDPELEKLLEKGKNSPQRILDGASDKRFGDTVPYAVTSVEVDFENEEDLRRCVRLLRWSDERLLAIKSSIAWAWAPTKREGMSISFAVNWYDKDFFNKKRAVVNNERHLSYFKLFGKSATDMKINTDIVGRKK